MKTWEKVRENVRNSIGQDDGPKNKSNTKSLLRICDMAEKKNIDPGYAEQASMSNLIEIIVEVKRAFKISDEAHVAELFQMAVELSNAELRVRLRGRYRETIKVVQKGKYYELLITENQYRRIKNATKTTYDFIEDIEK